jgi:hypothetical protein
MENVIYGNRVSAIMEIENQRDKELDNKSYNEIDVQSSEIKKKQRFVGNKDSNSKIVKYIYYLLGVLEVFFAFRFIFKILGANAESTFVSFIYSSTNLFLAPFAGIFRFAVADGIETKSVLEPNLIIGMIVYALLALGIAKLIEINRKNNNTPSL